MGEPRLHDISELKVVHSDVDSIPLRGWILCQGCGNLHTGGRSKGRSAYYNYYRCKRCKGENYSAEKVHAEIAEILKGLSLKKSYTKALQIVFEQELDIELKSRNAELEKAKKQHTEVLDKIKSLEKKYIENKIGDESYNRWFPSFKKELENVNERLETLNRDDQDVRKLFDNYMEYLTDLNFVYEGKCDTPQKQTYLSGILIGGFTKEKVGGRTGMINSMFYANSLQIGHLLRVEKTGMIQSSETFPSVHPEGTQSNQIYTFLKIIERIINNKAA